MYRDEMRGTCCTFVGQDSPEENCILHILFVAEPLVEGDKS